MVSVCRGLERSATRIGIGAALLAAAVLAAPACGSSNKSTEEDEEIALETPKLTISKKDGKIIKRYDTDADGKPNVVEHVEHYADPKNPNVTRKRLTLKKIDVNGDGEFDIIKTYDDDGVLKQEKTDTDLDGIADVVSYYSSESKNLSRKEILGKNGESVVAQRFYTGGKLDRVEKDTDGNGKADYYEYYRDGKLQRIGRDTNADGKIDDWTHRPRRRASTSETDPEDVANPTESGASEGGDSGGDESEGDGSDGGGSKESGSESGESDSKG